MDRINRRVNNWIDKQFKANKTRIIEVSQWFISHPWLLVVIVIVILMIASWFQTNPVSSNPATETPATSTFPPIPTPLGYDRVSIVLDYYQCINNADPNVDANNLNYIGACYSIRTTHYQTSGLQGFIDNYIDKVVGGILKYCGDETVLSEYQLYDRTSRLQIDGNYYLRFIFMQNADKKFLIDVGYDSPEDFNTWRTNNHLPQVKTITDYCDGDPIEFTPSLTPTPTP